MKRCIIIGSSPETDTETIQKNIGKNDFVVCADGGRIFTEKIGLIPDMIIGDFDSSPFPKDFQGEIIKLPKMKDDTDTMYCVKECIKRGYHHFTLFGMLGGREDHTYANLCTLLYLSRCGCTARLVGAEREILITESQTKIDHQNGLMFSIFPFGCEKCVVSLHGFLYELEKGTLTADFPLGVSNEIVSDSAIVTVHEGTAVIYIGKNN